MSVSLDINFRSLEDVIVCSEATAPLCIRAVTPSVDPKTLSTAGPFSNQAKMHVYVRLESLPRELREKVLMVVDSLQWG